MSDFIGEFVQALLRESGLSLTTAQQARYVPQISRQIQERLALEFMPRFTSAQADDFAELANRVATADEWLRFWEAAIPDFKTEAERVLRAFAAELRQNLQSLPLTP